jgi:ubiquinone biosynthesis protein COQ9
MDKEKAASDILSHALPLVAFEGWNQAMLGQAAIAAGYKKTDAIRVFPGGALDAVDLFFATASRDMLAELERYNLPTMKIRERVATCVRIWLTAQEKNREALRRAMALQALPLNCHHALQSLYNTVDDIWHATSDTSTDFNFYTKRLLLAGVFSSTVLYWLDDKSPGYTATWAFLDRRIEDVMKIEKAKSQIKKWIGA